MSTSEDVYTVEKIVDHRIIDGKTQFLVRWEGYFPEDDTWEPFENLEDCRDVLNEYRILQRSKHGQAPSQNEKKLSPHDYGLPDTSDSDDSDAGVADNSRMLQKKTLPTTSGKECGKSSVEEKIKKPKTFKRISRVVSSSDSDNDVISVTSILAKTKAANEDATMEKMESDEEENLLITKMCQKPIEDRRKSVDETRVAQSKHSAQRAPNDASSKKKKEKTQVISTKKPVKSNSFDRDEDCRKSVDETSIVQSKHSAQRAPDDTSSKKKNEKTQVISTKKPMKSNSFDRDEDCRKSVDDTSVVKSKHSAQHTSTDTSSKEKKGKTQVISTKKPVKSNSFDRDEDCRKSVDETSIGQSKHSAQRAPDDTSSKKKNEKTQVMSTKKLVKSNSFDRDEDCRKSVDETSIIQSKHSTQRTSTDTSSKEKKGKTQVISSIKPDYLQECRSSANSYPEPDETKSKYVSAKIKCKKPVSSTSEVESSSPNDYLKTFHIPKKTQKASNLSGEKNNLASKVDAKRTTSATVTSVEATNYGASTSGICKQPKPLKTLPICKLNPSSKAMNHVDLVSEILQQSERKLKPSSANFTRERCASETVSTASPMEVCEQPKMSQKQRSVSEASPSASAMGINEMSKVDARLTASATVTSVEAINDGASTSGICKQTKEIKIRPSFKTNPKERASASEAVSSASAMEVCERPKTPQKQYAFNHSASEIILSTLAADSGELSVESLNPLSQFTGMSIEEHTDQSQECERESPPLHEISADLICWTPKSDDNQSVDGESCAMANQRSESKKNTDEAAPTIPIAQIELMHDYVKHGKYKEIETWYNGQKKHDWEMINPRGATLLMQAAWNGRCDIVKMLLLNGAKVNAQHVGMKNTAMITACDARNIIVPTILEVLKSLIAFGGKLNMVNDSGETALIMASKRGYAEVVKFLLDLGADFYVKAKPKTKYGQQMTALDFAEWNLKNHPLARKDYSEIVRMISDLEAKLTSAFENQVKLVLDGHGELLDPLFDTRILCLFEDTKFMIPFKYKDQDLEPDTGFLLFVAHALYSTKGEVTIRMYGDATAVTHIKLNGVALIGIVEKDHVLSFCPVNEGENRLEFFTEDVHNSDVKLIVRAYRVRLLK